MRRHPLLQATLPAVLVALLLAACAAPGSGSPDSPASPTGSAVKASVLPVLINSQLVVGPNRFLFSFLDAAGNRPVAAPDRTATVAFTPPGATEPGAPIPAEFIWAIEGSRGVYVAPVEFSEPGSWTVVFTTQAPDGPREAISFGFDVREDGTAVAVGEPAPSSDTPTADDVDGALERLSTDKAPDPRFYATSVAEALAAGDPFVLVFATPAFCQTEQCGPTLDRVKEVAADHPDLVFINVEPFKLQFVEGRLQPDLDANNRLQPVDAVMEWGILTEPWVYVVDAEGVVRGSFEGVLSTDELDASIRATLGS
jgi:hypothetical protein